MKPVRMLLLLGAVLLEAGCGLPDSYYLQPPILTTAASITTNFFVFANPVHDATHDINASFTGDELYYKLYGDQSIDVNAYDPNSPNDPAAQLTSKGFYPLCLASDSVGSRTDPVIAIDPGTAAAGSSVTVYINQPPGESALSTFAVDTNPAVEIRRSTANTINGTIYKTFQENNFNSGLSAGNGYVQEDPDFASAYVGASTNGVLYVAWYAISYGYTVTSTPVRSSAVYLGYMAIPYP